MNEPLALRARAEEEAGQLPALLARAERLAGTVLLGEHGRRRAGMGDDFWQYRPVREGDSRRMIDHRRSARGDIQFVREREWQIAQTVIMWIDQGASMRYASDGVAETKIQRARLLGLAMSILLVRGGERVGLTGTTLPPRRGNAQIVRLAEMLTRDSDEDYALPEHRAMIPHARAVFVSDFLNDFEEVKLALTKAADRGVRGALYQVLDPSEESFPYQGRTIFRSIGGSLSHETLKAGELRTRYRDRLAARRDELQALCRATGWQFGVHHTNDSAQSALIWLYHALDGSRR
ncbi:MAG: DUF58 domain-containing protein [Paracoccaceae bacterium]